MRDNPRVAVHPAWIALGVVVLTVCAFLPALRNGFAWDDELNFLGNPAYRGLGWAQLRWMFTTAYLGPYQPLSWLSSGLDYALWGMSPVGYHLGNLLLHAANAALVYLLALRLLPTAPAGPAREDARRLHLCAAAAALLFALHPLRVEAVAWATERRGVLAGFFYFSAIWCWLNAGLGRAFAPVLFLLSLLSKGSGVALPLTLLALEVYPLRRLPADPRRWTGTDARAVLREKIPYFLLAASFGVVELIAYSKYLPAGHGDGPLLRAAKACYALAFYAVKTVAPFHLSPSYAPPSSAALIAGVAFTAAVSWLLWRGRERWPFGLPVWVHYAATLAPVLGLFKFGEHLTADRYSYLACAAWPLLAAGGLWSLGRDRKAFRFALGVTVVVLACLSLLTWRQAAVWRDSIRLWNYALVLEPDSAFVRKSLARSYYNRGNAFLSQGRPREAWTLYVNSLRFDPDASMTHNNMGIIALNVGSPDQAVARFARALELDPNNAIAYNGLGLALLRRGAREEGAAQFCRALRIDPALNGAAQNLRAVLAKYPLLSKGLDDECRQRLTKPE